MTRPLEITIVTETFNLAEGQGLEALRAALAYICGLARRQGGIEIMLVDSMPANLIVDDLLRRFAPIRHLHAPGAGYEGIKNLAAREARGAYVVYLDSDCVPVDDMWLEALVAPLRAGVATATAGVTQYDGTTLLHRVMTILDFGFVVADRSEIVGCYASNNCAFLRQARIDVPAPDGPMRCTCYAHAQRLIRVGRPMHRAPAAVATHELPPVFKERWRRGYDLVAACWINPELPETRWLRWGVAAAPRFIAANIALDWRRLGEGRRLWGWGWTTLAAARALAVALRLIDLGGAVRALALGPDARWAAYGPASSGENPA